MELGPERRQIRAAAPDRFDDAHAIDDAQGRRGAQIVGHGLGDARGQPRQLAVAADVGEVEHRYRRLLRQPLEDAVAQAAGAVAPGRRGAVVVTGAMNR